MKSSFLKLTTFLLLIVGAVLLSSCVSVQPVPPNTPSITIDQPYSRNIEVGRIWHIIVHEEDLRASVYGYTRAILDMAPDWRVFCDMTLSKKSAKPDLIFFRSSDGHDKNETVEILVEIKHWPRKKQIRSDIQKLIKLGEKFKSQRAPPTLVFIAILGDKIDSVDDGKTGKLEQELEQEFNNPKVKVNVWFRRHRKIYCGPWDKKVKLDPWRNCLKKIQCSTAR